MPATETHHPLHATATLRVLVRVFLWRNQGDALLLAWLEWCVEADEGKHGEEASYLLHRVLFREIVPEWHRGGWRFALAEAVLTWREQREWRKWQ